MLVLLGIIALRYESEIKWDTDIFRAYLVLGCRFNIPGVVSGRQEHARISTLTLR
jgi:hypothetical protein